MSLSTTPAYRQPGWLAAFVAAHPAVARRYLQLDVRSLGFVRLYLGALLIADLLRRAAGLSTWYSNDGLLPNHTLLWRPPAEPQISWFFTASTVGQATALFVLTGIVYLLFFLGYRTRLFHALSLLALINLHGRLLLFEDGSEVTLRLLCTWTLFLPMGARFSIDAVRRSLRGQIEAHPQALANRKVFAASQAPASSLAVLAILLQIVVIYSFNALHKTGETWRDGSAFHYVLHQDRIVTWLGWRLRSAVTPTLSLIASWAAVAAEAVLPLIVLNPWRWKISRRLALALALLLHAGFAAILNLGLFSFNMVGFFLLLLTDRDWATLARWFGRREARRRIVYIDASCGMCFALTRLLARLDVFGHLTLVANDAEDRPADLCDEVIARTIVVDDPARGQRWTRAAAIAQIFAALPGCAPLYWLLSVPPVRWLADQVYDFVSNRRTRISVALGLAACGLPQKSQSRLSQVAAVPPIAEWMRAQAAGAREVAVLILMVACASQVLKENRAVPRALRLRQPSLLSTFIGYPRLMQGWSMFAPEAPKADHTVVVEADTIEGRLIDPLAMASAREAHAPTSAVQESSDLNEFFCDYIAQIPWRPEYFDPLADWLFRHHERSGRKQDRVSSFRVYLIKDESPPPGQVLPRDIKKTLLFERVAR